jgi:RHS repeat-associated protein
VLQDVNGGSVTSESYTFDKVGNHLSSVGLDSWLYNSSNQLTSTPATSFSYDNNGNMLTKSDANGTATYAWDFENRLASTFTPGAGITTFRYDPFGRRIQKSGSLGTTIYLYDGANIVAEYDGTGVLAAKYAQGAGVDQPLAMWLGGQVLYHQTDALGSITSLNDATGSSVVSYSYNSFGATTSVGSVINPFRYTGREWDSETGLYYYRARYYDPTTGRFINEDPVRFWSGVDFYKYVDNSPPNAVDPSGEQKIYGNWCGPDWTGGHKESYDPGHDHLMADGKPYYKPPDDALDKACMKHDMCYYNCRADNKCDKTARKNCMVSCNRELAGAAHNSGISGPREWAIETYMQNYGPPDSNVGSNESCGCTEGKK